MSFADIKDQDVPIRLLRNMLRQNRVPNGLLFWGPAGVGKRLTAMEMARAVNCREAEADACGTCLSCRKVTSGNHPDVRVIAPVNRSRVIKVEVIETVNEFASLHAFESAWRVFLIVDADRMNLAAQNHFLKTLEEPPGRSLFILISEFPRLLLPTIRSRCQQIRFGALRPETVADILCRARDLPPEHAASIARLSQGQVARALDLVDSEKRSVVLEVARRLDAREDPLRVAEEFTEYLDAQRKRIAAAAKAERSPIEWKEMSAEDKEQAEAEEKARVDAEYRRDMMEYLYLLETWYRDAALLQMLGDGAPILNHDQNAGLEAAPGGSLVNRIGALEKARLYLERFIKEERVFRDLFFALAP